MESSNRGRFTRTLASLVALATLIVAGGYGLKIAKASDAPQLSTLHQERAERKVLLSLEERRRTLETQAEELTLREARLKEATEELDKRLASLMTIRADLESLLAAEASLKLKKYKDMARIHASMPTQKSADLIASMDDTTAIRILNNLPKERVAKTLSKMKPERALELSEAFIGLSKAKN